MTFRPLAWAVLVGIAALVALLPAPALAQDVSNSASMEELEADPFAESSKEVETPRALADPMVRVNRKVFKFNDVFYFKVLRPATRGYKAVMPQPARKCVRNFFANLLEPVYFVNSILQGKPRDAQAAFTRFVVHSTVGIGGLLGPAIQRPETGKRNFDQTLAKWRVKPGMYIVWPIVGPSSVRGMFGFAAEEAMDPFNYGSAGLAAGASALESVNETSFQLGAYEDMKKYSLDTYTALKDIYEKKIHKKTQE